MPFPRALLAAIVLTVIPLSSASHHAPLHSYRHRRQSIPSSLPGSWTSQGCVTDNVDGVRTLTGPHFSSGDSMTIQTCITFCDAQNFVFAGVQASGECCENIAPSFIAAITTDLFLSVFDISLVPMAWCTRPMSMQCNTPCTGNSLQPCGGANRLNLFWSGDEFPSSSSQWSPVPRALEDWEDLGCWSDNVQGQRVLTTGMGVQGGMTTEKCQTACFNAGFRMAGTEYAGYVISFFPSVLAASSTSDASIHSTVVAATTPPSNLKCTDDSLFPFDFKIWLCLDASR
ncbi:hypothetical protein NMY22_g8708 [Coprinellus aureogranulatus]|nr:hypothetical protein NMY22_g8708 [Coprinellus aureogranulatus]